MRGEIDPQIGLLTLTTPEANAATFGAGRTPCGASHPGKKMQPSPSVLHACAGAASRPGEEQLTAAHMAPPDAGGA
jgi:hypothetical protein